MVLKLRCLSDVDFDRLMELYADVCIAAGNRLAPGASPAHQRELVREELRLDLRDGFFRQKGAAGYILTEADGTYLSGAWLEPYRDGILLQALTTRPDRRREGHADRLLRSLLGELPAGSRVYSHVGRTNAASAGVHLGCGFRKTQEFAVMLDGTVTTAYHTYFLAI